MTHWGEFKRPEVQNEEVIPAEIVKLFIMKAMQRDSFKNVLPNPPTNEGDVSLDLIASETKGLEMDDRVIHTIKLLQHAREMHQLIEAAKEQTELMADSHINTFPPALEIPEHPIPENIYKPNLPLQYTDKNYSNFSLGIGEPVSEISTSTANMLLKKSVATLLAHTGFDTCSETLLNAFTDVVDEYIKKMLTILRIQVDHGANYKANGFPDAMEKLFHEMNIGSIRVLHDYYQNRVVRYHELVLEECQALNREYNDISIPVNHEAISIDTLGKMEESDDVPEIHFPALGDGDGVDELQPSLETGFQMLHNLEQQVHLQNLDSQEDDSMVSISPGQDQIGLCSSSSDTIQTSHLIAKKRKRL